MRVKFVFTLSPRAAVLTYFDTGRASNLRVNQDVGTAAVVSSASASSRHAIPVAFSSADDRILSRRKVPGAPHLIPHLFQQYLLKVSAAKKITVIGMAVSGSLALTKLIVGWLAHSTAVFADGIENVGDLFGSGLVLYALFVASKPPDKQHPYGHGRSETIAGSAVGFLLGASGLGICYESFRRLHVPAEIPHLYGIWPLVASIIVKSGLSYGKFAFGKRLQSAAIRADAWHDGIEIISGGVALSALGLTLYDPVHFAAADHWGGFAVGVIVLITAFHVVRDTSNDLMDAMPDDERINLIRQVASQAPGVLGVEKTYARKIGLQYHVELHIEVNPLMTVQASHDLATTIRFSIREKLDWVADVVVHVEPFLDTVVTETAGRH